MLFRSGVVFYPAILIFSLLWQLLGGIIRFQVAVLIFFFTLFTPPEGGPCQCWKFDALDGYGDMATHYFQQGGGIGVGFCYECRAQNADCNEAISGLGIPAWVKTASPDRLKNKFKCREYCPVQQRLRNPSLTPAQAYAACVADYTAFTPKSHPTFTIAEVCSGHVMQNHTVYEVRPGYIEPQIGRAHV